MALIFYREKAVMALLLQEAQSVHSQGQSTTRGGRLVPIIGFSRGTN